MKKLTAGNRYKKNQKKKIEYNYSNFDEKKYKVISPKSSTYI